MEDKQKSPYVIPRATLQRLAGYLNFLRSKTGTDYERVSSAAIADSMKIPAITVRKDLAYIANGRPRVGHNRDELIERITAALGTNTCSEAVLVGVGNLGRALMCYNGFDNYGLKILAGFDVDKILMGIEILGKPVMHINYLRSFVQKTGARIGIICVPAAQAQEVCDMMVAAGIRGIMCFAPVHLFVPPHVTVRYEDFAVSLAMLSLSVVNKVNEE